MGAKTSEDHRNWGHANGPLSTHTSAAGGEPRGAHHFRDGDGSLGNQGDDDDDDDDNDADDVGPVSLNEAHETSNKKNKKKKNKKKKKKKSKTPSQQSSSPRVPLSHLFPTGEYPVGELLDYPENIQTARTTGEELRYLGRKHLEDPAFLSDYRKAAEIHRTVRQWVQQNVKPGQTTLREIAAEVEDGVRALLGNQCLEPGDWLKSGMGFPTGICLNNEVAHYTPNPGQKDVVLKYEDVMTIDFGVQINGWIVDSAFTMSFDPTYDNLLAAVKDATNTGIKTAGIDVRICDVSAAIQEAMESYEVEIGGKTYPVKPVRGLCAHDIKQYHIHGGKSIPFTRNSDETKMEEGEVFAIETFGTTGSGKILDDAGVYGYGLQEDAPRHVSLPFASANRLYKVIKEQFGSIVFCRRYLERLGVDRYLAGLNCLVSHGILEAYPPLMDIKGSYSAQFEHTILLKSSGKEVLSRGNDY